MLNPGKLEVSMSPVGSLRSLMVLLLHFVKSDVSSAAVWRELNKSPLGFWKVTLCRTLQHWVCFSDYVEIKHVPALGCRQLEVITPPLSHSRLCFCHIINPLCTHWASCNSDTQKYYTTDFTQKT